MGEWEEWGDPLHNRTVYDYIKSYSPIDNVVKMVPFPLDFLTVGLTVPLAHTVKG